LLRPFCSLSFSLIAFFSVRLGFNPPSRNTVFLPPMHSTFQFFLACSKINFPYSPRGRVQSSLFFFPFTSRRDVGTAALFLESLYLSFPQLAKRKKTHVTPAISLGFFSFSGEHHCRSGHLGLRICFPDDLSAPASKNTYSFVCYPFSLPIFVGILPIVHDYSE